MIKRLFRWRHWRARAKFWRRRALEAEASLEAERYRNMEREDTLLTVPMRAMGMFGMLPRSGPALSKLAMRPALTAPADPWEALNWGHRQEWEMEWKPDAERAGIDMRKAKEDFLAEIARRSQPLNDDPYN